MAVVINEFEVVAEPTPASKPTGTLQPGTPQPVPPSTPHDIERIVRRQRERFARVRAH